MIICSITLHTICIYVGNFLSYIKLKYQFPFLQSWSLMQGQGWLGLGHELVTYVGLGLAGHLCRARARAGQLARAELGLGQSCSLGLGLAGHLCRARAGQGQGWLVTYVGLGLARARAELVTYGIITHSNYLSNSGPLNLYNYLKVSKAKQGWILGIDLATSSALASEQLVVHQPLSNQQCTSL